MNQSELLLLYDPNAETRAAVALTLREAGYNVVECGDKTSAELLLKFDKFPTFVCMCESEWSQAWLCDLRRQLPGIRFFVLGNELNPERRSLLAAHKIESTKKSGYSLIIKLSLPSLTPAQARFTTAP